MGKQNQRNKRNNAAANQQHANNAATNSGSSNAAGAGVAGAAPAGSSFADILLFAANTEHNQAQRRNLQPLLLPEFASRPLGGSLFADQHAITTLATFATRAARVARNMPPSHAASTISARRYMLNLVTNAVPASSRDTLALVLDSRSSDELASLLPDGADPATFDMAPALLDLLLELYGYGELARAQLPTLAIGANGFANAVELIDFALLVNVVNESTLYSAHDVFLAVAAAIDTRLPNGYEELKALQAIVAAPSQANDDGDDTATRLAAIRTWALTRIVARDVWRTVAPAAPPQSSPAIAAINQSSARANSKQRDTPPCSFCSGHPAHWYVDCPTIAAARRALGLSAHGGDKQKCLACDGPHGVVKCPSPALLAISHRHGTPAVTPTPPAAATAPAISAVTSSATVNATKPYVFPSPTPRQPLRQRRRRRRQDNALARKRMRPSSPPLLPSPAPTPHVAPVAAPTPPASAPAPLPAPATLPALTTPPTASFAVAPATRTLAALAALRRVVHTPSSPVPTTSFCALSASLTVVAPRTHTLRTTIDTGANTSAIDYATALTLGCDIEPLCMLIDGPGATQFEACGTTSVRVTVGDKLLDVEALVIGNLGHQLLLGTRHLFGDVTRQLESRGVGSATEIDIRLGNTGSYTRAQFVVGATTAVATPPLDAPVRSLSVHDSISVGALNAPTSADDDTLVLLCSVGGVSRFALLTAPRLMDTGGALLVSEQVLSALDQLDIVPSDDAAAQHASLSASINALNIVPDLDDADPLGAGEVNARPPLAEVPAYVPDFLRCHVSPAASDARVLELAARLRANAHLYGGSGNAPRVSRCPPFKLELLPHADLTKLRARDRPLGPEAADAVRAQIVKWLPDVIEESNANFSSRPLVVLKKDGTWRLVIDYRRINNACHFIQYPNQRVDEVLSHVAQRGVIFSKLDGWAMFNTLPITDELTRDLTSFRALGKLYRFKRCPFGLSSLPAHLQRFMDVTFDDPRFKPYADDLTVAHASNTDAVVMADIDELHRRTDSADITFKAEKCYFFYLEFELLGHTVRANSIAPPPDRIDALLALQQPDTTSALRRFLHAMQSFSSHIPLFARHAAPLYSLAASCRGALEWTPETRAAFDALVSALRSPAVLAPFDSHRRVLLRTDFSFSAVCWVISQHDDAGRERIVHCGGMRLDPYAAAWAPQLGELVALREAIRKCPQYLTYLHEPFIWLCDNKPMTDTNATPSAHPSHNPMINRILTEISTVRFEAQHVSGSSAAQGLQDYLSRLTQTFPCTTSPVNALDVPPPGARHTADDHTIARRLATMSQFASAPDPLAAVVVWARSLPATSALALAAFPATVHDAPPFTPSAQLPTTAAARAVTGTPSLAPLHAGDSSGTRAPPSSPRTMMPSSDDAPTVSAPVVVAAPPASSLAPAAPVALVAPVAPGAVAAPAPVAAPAAAAPANGADALLHAVDPLARIDAAARPAAWRASLLADSEIAPLLRAADDDARTPAKAPTAFWDNQRLLRVPTHADRAAAVSTDTAIDRTHALILVPADRRLEVFSAYHYGDFAGHYAADTTLRLIKTMFYWPGIRRDVERWCNECHRCAVARHHRVHGGASIAPDVGGQAKLRCVAIDLIDMPTTHDGYNYALVMVDLCTRLVVVEPLRDKTAASTSAAFRRRWLLGYGVPWVVLSDNGSEFQGDEWRVMSREYGFARSYSAPYNPQGNSIAERAVQEVKNRLARVVEAQDGTDWAQHLERACAAINNEIGTRGYSSFELLVGQPMLTPAAARLGADSFVIRGSPAEVARITAERARHLIEIANTRRAQRQLNDMMRRRAKAPADTLDVGDVVGRVTHDTNASKFGRLARGVPGPFIIIAKAPYSSDGYGAFQLARPDGSLVTEQYVPARQLVRWKGDAFAPSPPAVAAEPGAQAWTGIHDRSLLGPQLLNESTSHDNALANAAAAQLTLADRLVAAEERVIEEIAADRRRLARAADNESIRTTLANATADAIDDFLQRDTPLPTRGVVVHDTLPFPVREVLGVQRMASGRHSTVCVVEFNDSGKSRAIVDASLVDRSLISEYNRRARTARHS